MTVLLACPKEPGLELAPEVRRQAWGLSRRIASSRVPREDLIQEGYLRLIQDGKLDAEPRITGRRLRLAMLSHRRAELTGTKSTRRKEIIDHDEADGSLPDPEYPEPTDGLVSLVQCLTDYQAEVLTLACGLDGAAPRSAREVGHVIGKGKGAVEDALRKAIAKLRAELEKRAGAGITLTKE